MKINHPATMEKIRQTRPSVIAGHCQVTTTLVTAVINGTYKCMDGPKAQRVIQHLRDLGVLVEIDTSRIAA